MKNAKWFLFALVMQVSVLATAQEAGYPKPFSITISYGSDIEWIFDCHNYSSVGDITVAGVPKPFGFYERYGTYPTTWLYTESPTRIYVDVENRNCSRTWTTTNATNFPGPSDRGAFCINDYDVYMGGDFMGRLVYNAPVLTPPWPEGTAGFTVDNQIICKESIPILTHDVGIGDVYEWEINVDLARLGEAGYRIFTTTTTPRIDFSARAIASGLGIDVNTVYDIPLWVRVKPQLGTNRTCGSYSRTSEARLVTFRRPIPSLADISTTPSCPNVNTGTISFANVRMESGAAYDPTGIEFQLQDTDGNFINRQAIGASRSGTIGNLPPGTYVPLLFYTTNNCNHYFAPVTIGSFPILSSGGTPTLRNPSCSGRTDGTIAVSVAGGRAPYQYTISGGSLSSPVVQTGSVNHMFSGLGGGVYNIVVRDDCGQQVSFMNQTLYDPLSLSINTITPTDVVCIAAGPSGRVSIASNGLAGVNYTYTISGPVNHSETVMSPLYTSPAILSAGNYTISMSDGICSTSQAFTIGSLSPHTVSGTKVDALCYNIRTGAITLTGSGGFAGRYEYSIDGINFSSSNYFTGLQGGQNYTPYVRDATYPACRASGDVIAVNQPAQISVTINQNIPAVCFGEASGAVTVSASGGMPTFGTYTYELTKPSFADDIVTSGVASFTNLESGTYWLTTTDGVAGCVVGQPVVITQPLQVKFKPTLHEYDGVNVSCASAADGIVSFASTGGTYPLTVKVDGWSDQIINSSADVATFNGFRGNINYEFTIAYKGGLCEVDTTIVFTAPSGLTVETGPAVTYGDDYDVSCHGSNDGILYVKSEGGILPYTYELTPNGIPTSYTSTMADSVVFGQLSAQSYTVIVRDNNSCTFETSVVLQEPDELTSNTQLPDYTGYALRCYGDRDAAVNVRPSGGSYPQTVTLGANVQVATIAEAGTDAMFANLAAGNYTYSIVDEAGCGTTGSFELVQPTALQFDNAETLLLKPECSNAREGSIQVKARGGVKIGSTIVSGVRVEGNAYDYALTYSSYPPVPALPFFYPEEQYLQGDRVMFDELIAGPYSMMVTDKNGCTASIPLSLPTGRQVSINTLDKKSITCKEDQNGSIELSVNGGLEPYAVTTRDASFDVVQTRAAVGDNEVININTLSEGLYYMQIEDATGCSVYSGTNSFQIEGPPDELALTIDVSEITCFGNNNGNVLLSATGGWREGSYVYGNNLSTLAVGNDLFDNLVPGNHTFYVRDSRSCIATHTITLIEPAVMASDIGNITMVSCNGLRDGSIALQVSGGTEPYSVSYDNRVNWIESVSIDNLPADNYEIHVKDSRGCSDTQVVRITEPNALQALLVTKENTLCKETNGSITTNIAGGTSPYTLEWHNEEGTGFGNNPVLANLLAGTYTLDVSDVNGCSSQLHVPIINSNDIVFDVITSGVSCFGGTNGIGRIQLTQVQAPYVVTWDDGSAALEVNTFASGVHSVSIEDSNNCIVTREFEVTSPDEIIVDVTDQKIPSCHGICDGMLQLTSSGGTGALRHEWTDGNTSTTRNNLCAGEYTITLTDANNCSVERTVTLTAPEKIDLEIKESYAICQGQTVQLSPKGWAEYRWTSTNGFASTASSVSLQTEGKYALTVTDNKGCQREASFTLNYSSELLKAEFLVPGVAYVNDTVIVVNITQPDPEILRWTFDKNSAISVAEYGHYNEIVFLKEGTFDITLETQLGQCVDQQHKTISIVANTEENDDGGRLGYVEKGIKEMVVYPNPNDGIFSCRVELYKTGGIQLRLKDMSGKELILKKLEGSTSYEVNYNISNHSSGMYWLIAETSDDVKTERVMVK